MAGSCPRRHCQLLAARGGQRAMARARVVATVRLSAQPPADRSVQPLIQRHGWTAPAHGWAARHCSGPPWRATRSNGCCACAPTSAPQGAHKEGTGAAALCPCHCFLSPPIPLVEGALRLAALLEVGQLVFYWPGCVLRPLQASPPAKPQDACLLLAGRALSTTLAALTQRCQLLRRCSSSFQGSAM